MTHWQPGSALAAQLTGPAAGGRGSLVTVTVPVTPRLDDDSDHGTATSPSRDRHGPSRRDQCGPAIMMMIMPVTASARLSATRIIGSDSESAGPRVTSPSWHAAGRESSCQWHHGMTQ